MKRFVLIFIFTLVVFIAIPSCSVPVTITVIKVVKPIVKKIYPKFSKWVGNYKLPLKPANFPEDIWLTVSSSGERFRKFAKSRASLIRNKGLTARAGKDVKSILCNKSLSIKEMRKVLNGMKAKRYYFEAGGVKEYKALNSFSRENLRSTATDYLNSLIQNVQGKECEVMILQKGS